MKKIFIFFQYCVDEINNQMTASTSTDRNPSIMKTYTSRKPCITKISTLMNNIQVKHMQIEDKISPQHKYSSDTSNTFTILRNIINICQESFQ